MFIIETNNVEIRRRLHDNHLIRVIETCMLAIEMNNTEIRKRLVRLVIGVGGGTRF